MKPVVTVPNNVLITPAARVTKFDAKLRELLLQMHTSLLAAVDPKGVGLAAPQIGVPLQVFVTKPTPKAPIRDFINPEIISKSDHLTSGPPSHGSGEAGKLEGCLSIPDIWGNVHRAESLTLRYQDANGETHTETFKGFLATIIQHETDHVVGILFTQRVLEQKEKLYQVATDEEGKEFLEEIRIP